MWSQVGSLPTNIGTEGRVVGEGLWHLKLFNWFFVLFISFRDAKCGKIQCQGGANRPVIGTNAVSIETNIPLQEGGKILCRGTHVYLGDDMPDPGLVLSGTKCEDGKVRFWNNPEQGELHYPHAAKYFVLNWLVFALGFFFPQKNCSSCSHWVRFLLPSFGHCSGLQICRCKASCLSL